MSGGYIAGGRLKKGWVGLDNASKGLIKKGWVGDEKGVPRLFWGSSNLIIAYGNDTTKGCFMCYDIISKKERFRYNLYGVYDRSINYIHLLSDNTITYMSDSTDIVKVTIDGKEISRYKFPKERYTFDTLMTFVPNDVKEDIFFFTRNTPEGQCTITKIKEGTILDTRYTVDSIYSPAYCFNLNNEVIIECLRYNCSDISKKINYIQNFTKILNYLDNDIITKYTSGTANSYACGVRRMKRTGEIVWSCQLNINGNINDFTTDKNGNIYTVSADKKITHINSEGIKVNEATLNEDLRNVTIDSLGNIYVLTVGGSIYTLNNKLSILNVANNIIPSGFKYSRIFTTDGDPFVNKINW